MIETAQEYLDAVDSQMLKKRVITEKKLSVKELNDLFKDRCITAGIDMKHKNLLYCIIYNHTVSFVEIDVNFFAKKKRTLKKYVKLFSGGDEYV